MLIKKIPSDDLETIQAQGSLYNDLHSFSGLETSQLQATGCKHRLCKTLSLELKELLPLVASGGDVHREAGDFYHLTCPSGRLTYRRHKEQIWDCSFFPFVISLQSLKYYVKSNAVYWAG